tara:strand:+ start:1013 stop:1975 length:963 start_codon:yes stop_codon:yes gene_type:complete
MASSNIAYCTDRDLSDVFPGISEFDLKTRIINWQTTGTSNLYLARNSGLVTQLFSDGEDLGDAEANSGVVNANGEWYYDSDLDTVYYFDSATNPNDRVMETGDDWATIKTRFRKRASRLIESMIDYRVAGEIWKDREGNYPDVIVRAAALQTAILLIKSQDPSSDLILPYQDELDNYMEGLRAGTIVLPSQSTVDASKGIIREVSVNGSTAVRPVELRGTYGGSGYDIIKLKVIDGGVLGTATYSVWVKSSESPKADQVLTAEKITGDYDLLVWGLYVRFAGLADDSVATANDEYEIPVYSNYLDSSTPGQVGTIGMTRR